MCELCVNTSSKATVSNRYDPTRTTVLRNRATVESNRRFKELIGKIKRLVVTEDVFGLNEIHTFVEPGERGYQFLSNAQKVEEFRKWLEEQIEKGIITVEDLGQSGPAYFKTWWGKYVTDSYKRGRTRAQSELEKSGYDVSFTDLFVPLQIDALALVYIRAYSELKGITSQMSQLISRVLAQGLADGDGAKVLAKKLVSVINGAGVGDLGITDSLGRFIPAMRRAEIMVRTELIRAHHLAMVNEFRNWKIDGVYIIAEWRTAGDTRVCSICAANEGKRFTLDEVEGMIPAHPQCRCCILPIVDKKGKQ